MVRFFLLLFWFFFNSPLALFFFVSLEKSFSLVVFFRIDFMALHMPERLSVSSLVVILLSWWFSRCVGNWYQIGRLVVI